MAEVNSIGSGWINIPCTTCGSKWKSSETKGPNGGIRQPVRHAFTITFEFTYDGSGFKKEGTGTLKVDGMVVATETMEHTLAITFPEDETFDVASDTRTPVSRTEYPYDRPITCTGKIHRRTFARGRPKFVGPKPSPASCMICGRGPLNVEQWSSIVPYLEPLRG